MGVTSHDVAKLAGVSQPTVSRALRGERNVSDETREKVLRAARELSYVPSETGRSLSTRSTQRIGLVADDLTNPFYPQLVQPLRDHLERSGYRTLLIADHVDEPVEIERLADGSLDGVILTTTLLGSSLPRELKARGIACVLANREVADLVVDTVTVDNRAGAAQAARLLADLGHRRVAAILGPHDTSTGRDREVGFREELAARGIPLPAHLVRRGEFTFEAGYDAVTDLLTVPSPPTAVFCGNDVIAMGARCAAAALGREVPRELTLLGFDDIAMAGWEVFALTSVHCDLTAMAGHAVRLLMDRIKEPAKDAEHVVLTPTLTLRRTHAAPEHTLTSSEDGPGR